MGPLEGFAGEVLEIDNENQKCKVNISMFNRKTTVDLDYSQIEII